MLQPVLKAPAHEERGKELIMYHRSYRKLPGSFRTILLQFLLCFILFAAPFFCFYPQVTKLLCQLSKTLLDSFFFADTIKITAIPYFKWVGDLYYLDLPGKLPTLAFSLGNILFSLMLLVFFGFTNYGKPLMISGAMITAIHLVASLFFLFAPGGFPYSAANYSELYIKQQIGIWFFMPLLLGMSILPLPAPWPTKFFAIAAAVLYSLVFGTLRYIVFLYIISQVSMLYMAILYFALGPLIDFVYGVGIYSLYLSWLLKKSKGNIALWRWY